MSKVALTMPVNLVRGGGNAVVGFWKDFADFINRGNVIDLAVGVIMGAAFGSIVTSFVNDLVSPLIGLAIRIQ